MIPIRSAAFMAAAGSTRVGSQPIGWALASGGELPNWGSGFKQRLADFPRSMVSSGHCTSLAMASNSVSLDPALKDAWGIPAIRVTYKDHPDDLATAAFLQAVGAARAWSQWPFFLNRFLAGDLDASPPSAGSTSSASPIS